MPGHDQRYVGRLVDDALSSLVAAHPAVMVVGPRACGKTTTAARVAAATVRLDVPREAAVFRADADAALRELVATAEAAGGPLLIDEWQEVPEVLSAVKRAVDADPRPGRFLLTGSALAPLEQRAWPATGRLIRLAMGPLTLRELVAQTASPSLVDRLAVLAPPTLPADVPDLPGYVRLAVRGGFPEAALACDDAAAARWYRSYVSDVLDRDLLRVAAGRDPGRLRRYFEAYALSTARVTQHATIYEAAGISRTAAEAYESLLEGLCLVVPVPAWWTNRLKRLGVTPKRFIVDCALLRAFVSLDTPAVLRDGDLLGRLLETFVLTQVLAETQVWTTLGGLHHLRHEAGRHEVDLLVEQADGRIVAFEVKADAAPDRRSAAHLIWLRDRLGERFAAGAVLHTGPRVYELDDRISAVPICALWG